MEEEGEGIECLMDIPESKASTSGVFSFHNGVLRVHVCLSATKPWDGDCWKEEMESEREEVVSD